MNRIEQIFQSLQSSGRKALMPFITAGYPSLDAMGGILKAMDEAGASVCEVGIPFSDPIADGPVIQASMTAALDKGVTVGAVFDQIAGLREQLSMGLVAMVSYSIVYRMGMDRFIGRAKEAGFDGFIFPDLPLEEADRVRRSVREAGLIHSMLVAPTTPAERAAEIARTSSGFVYVVARTGITGERQEVPEDLVQRVTALRQVTRLPIAVGFGISTAEHVRVVCEVADAAIVGSALVKRLGACEESQSAAEAGAFVRELSAGLPGQQ
jgi:tryptophan synthase alpha chain